MSRLRMIVRERQDGDGPDRGCTAGLHLTEDQGSSDDHEEHRRGDDDGEKAASRRGLAGGDDGVAIPGDRSDEAISAASQGLDEARVIGRIVERRTKFADRGIEAVIEIDELGCPELLAQLLARDHLAGAGDENGEESEGLLLERNPNPVAAELAAAQVELEDPEAGHARLAEALHARITCVDNVCHISSLRDYLRSSRK